jgi:hypothetical protein
MVPLPGYGIYMQAHTSLRESLCESLKAAKVEDRDAATVELARNYARLIDAAAPAAKYAKPLAAVQQVVNGSEDPFLAEHWDKIVTALAEHTVASDLGPKYLAALAALGLTPASRAVKGGASNDSEPSPLDELRERRRTRAQRAAAVDATAT